MRLVAALLISASVPAANAGQFRVFDPKEPFACSPRAEIECSGLFPPRPLSDGNLGAHLTNGEASLRARIATLKRARKSIRIQTHVFRGDESGLEIARVLKEKRAEGVEVRVIVDAISNFSDSTTDFKRLLGGHAASATQTRDMDLDLRQHGVEIVGWEPQHRELLDYVDSRDHSILEFNKRLHEKIWVVDAGGPDAVAIVGGMNLADDYFRVLGEASGVWRDQDLMVTGGIVSDISASFDRNWAYFQGIKQRLPKTLSSDAAWEKQEKQLREGKLDLRFAHDQATHARLLKILAADLPGPVSRPAAMRYFQNRPRYGETYVLQAYLKMIEDAREEILISNAYFLPLPEIASALNAALARGVRITILTNSPETNDLKSATALTRAHYLELMEKGAAIREWQGHLHGEGTTHAKYAVFDRRAAIVGSYNLDTRSQLLNSENIVALEGADLADELARVFVSNDVAKSRAVGIEEARGYSKPPSVLERLKLRFSKPVESFI